VNLTIRFRPNNLKAQIDDLLGQIKEVLIAGAKADIELEVICREQRPDTVTKTYYDLDLITDRLEDVPYMLDRKRFLRQFSCLPGNVAWPSGDFYGKAELEQAYGDQIFYADVRWA
jgi:hypothetical protein